MESHGAEKIITEGAAEASETTIEIKIKTLDSQTYNLKVNKQMPVPALKEKIASVTGVLSEQQRLICRGKVLKDDQLLSAYHVEDGHTLHMVVRQPILPSTDSGFNHSAADPASGSSRSRISPNVVIETFSVPDQGEGVPPEFGRIVSAILGSFGFSNISSGSNGIDVGEHGSQRFERNSGAGLTTDSSEPQYEQAGTRSQTDRPHLPQGAFGVTSAVPLEPLQPPVLPDSLTTLSQYLSRLKQEFDGTFRGEVNEPQPSFSRDGNRETTFASNPATAQERLPTPASLAELLLSTRLLLVEQVGDRLNQLARQLVDQGNVTESAARATIQSNAWRTGVFLHNLGSFLLELGRTTMTARLGQTPTEAVVNAGPAVFVSPSGPNPLMVQPLPLQPGGFGAIPVVSAQPNSGVINGLGSTFLPRRIDIQIRRATPNINREESGETQQPSGQRTSAARGSTDQNPSNQTTFGVSESPLSGEPGVRVVPIRTVVATIPAPFSRQSSDSQGQGNDRGTQYPLLGRLQRVASEDMNVNQAVGQHLSDGMQTELPPVSEGSVQQQNPEGNARDGSSSNPSSRQQNRPARSISINVLTASGAQTNQESERQIPNSFLHLLRTVFPGAELATEETNSEPLPAQCAPQNAGVSSDPTPESGITEEGIFLSNLLTQIMPIISQGTSGQEGGMPQEAGASAQVENSNAGASRRPDDSDTSPPSSKRQKMD